MTDLSHQPLPMVDVGDCTLEPAELEVQLDRYRRLGRHTTGVRHGERQVLVKFSDRVPAELLQRTLKVERRCCPLFLTDYDPTARVLTISVERDDQRAQLDALAQALSAGL